MNSCDPSKRSELVAHYERLRVDILSLPATATTSAGSLGLALFVRQGMAAWMCVWSRCMHDPEVETTILPRDTSAHYPVETREQITQILAGMILGREQEAFR